MISSTSFDLPEHRKKVIDAVLRAGCHPLAMEHGTAVSNSDAIRFSLDLVDQADIYVGIFAQRYGFVPDNALDNPQGWSVTEHEYRRAKEHGIPRLIYLASEDHKFAITDIDLDPEKRTKLDALKEELKKDICGFFSDPAELHSLVVQSLFQEKEKHGPISEPDTPAAESSIPHPPELYAVPPYILTSTFVGRKAELADLDAWAASTDPVMVVEAIGGMGKSALTWEWMEQRALVQIPGLAGRVWWSFYERGTSMQTFLRHALAYVTRQDPEALRNLGQYECGQQLLVELKEKPHLLVLDGFERVLTAYHRFDKAQMPDDQVPVDKRECVNPKDGEVLRQLVRCGPSKILVSSRLMPSALEDRSSHKPIPGVRHLELEGLAPSDALRMMTASGIRGDSGAMLRFADQFRRHSLVLKIVCGMITDYRPNPGDFNAWRADSSAGGGLKVSELPLRQRYSNILEYALRGLEEKTRQLLSRIAVLSDGADYAAISALNPFSRQEGLTVFHAALGDLEDRGLLQWDRITNAYDLHPVVRAYAFEQLEERERSQAYNVIHDYFAGLPPEDTRAATELAQIKNSVEIVRSLMGAGRFEEALNFYTQRISDSLLYSIGAYHLVVEMMSPLSQSSRIVANVSLRSYLSNHLAVALAVLGQYEGAMALYRESLSLYLKSGNIKSLAVGLINWSKLSRLQGKMYVSVRCIDLAAEISGMLDDQEEVTMCLLDKMASAISRGMFAEAELLFEDFRLREPAEFIVIYQPGLPGVQRAGFLFYQDKLTAVDLDRAEQIAFEGRDLHSQRHIAIIRAEWELVQGNPEPALAATERALAIVRRTGEPAADYLGLRALALAGLGRSADARDALLEAQESSIEKKYFYERVTAEAWLALGAHDQARTAVRRAYTFAWADGAPYSLWYELKRCREIMTQLGEPEPQLPPFDPTKVESIPCEAEIRAAIEKFKVERKAAEAAREKSHSRKKKRHKGRQVQ